MWKQLFQDHILGRGFDYYNRDLVANLYVSDKIIEANVYGSEEYKVDIIKEDGNIIDLSCNCPYANDGSYCKHMAAVLFYVENESKVTETVIGQDTEESIAKLIKKADKTVIKTFLADILKNDEKLLNRFKSALCCEILPADMKRYKNQVNNIFRRYAGRHNFIDYKNAWYFTSELEEFLDNDIQAMLDNKELKEAFELTNYVFIKIGNQDMDDSDGGTGILAEMCLRIWREILKNCDITLKREIFRCFINHLYGSVIDYMEEYIEQIIFEDFKEEEFLENKLIFIDDQINEYKKEKNSWLSSYKLGELALRHIEILEEKKVEQKEIEEYCKDNLEFNRVREYYIDNCIKKKEYGIAIEVLKEGKHKEKDSPGLVANYSLKLKDLYKKLKDQKSYEEELWALVLNYKAGDIELYEELKSIYTDKEWIEKREIIFKNLPSYAQIDKLYEIEKLYDKLVDIVTSAPGLYMLMEHEETLKDIYPVELLQKYENVVKAMATNTSDRKRYKEIVSILRRMENYPEGKLKVLEIINDWRLRYKNRPAMMDELNKL